MCSNIMAFVIQTKGILDVYSGQFSHLPANAIGFSLHSAKESFF